MRGKYLPPYTVSDQMVNLIASISEMIGKISIDNKMRSNPKLRRDNRIKTIHASLAIENNSLSLNQVTDIINGKRILGPPNEIQEVKNAFEAYEMLLAFDPYSYKDLLKAHAILMKDLVKDSGNYRVGGVGVFAGELLVHMAPPPERVAQQINDLIDWAKNAPVHPLIKSCIFHYEFEFIHPFMDGNGRMGRMWQTLLLCQWNPVFAWLPIETLIKERQDEYYQVLGEADRVGHSSAFIEFLLQTINDALEDVIYTEQAGEQVTDQVIRLLKAMGNEVLSTKELMERVGLKHRPTFRENYLLPALKAGLIEMTIPDKPNSSRQKYRACAP